MLAGLSQVAAAPGAAGPQQTGRGAVGSAAADLFLDGLQGDSIRLLRPSAATGRLAVVVFWSRRNRPSAVELERLVRLWPKWSRHGVGVVAVCVEGPRIDAAELQLVRDWVEERSLPFPVAIDRGLAAFHAYGVVALPTTVVVDESGTVVFRMPGYPVAGAELFVDAVETRVLEASPALRASRAPVPSGRARALRRMSLGLHLARNGESELSEYTLRAAVEDDPDLLDARLALAALYEGAARVEEARRVLAEAAASFPDDSRLLLARAELEQRRGRRDVAGELASRALEQNPSLDSALVLLARLRREEAGPEAALELLLRAADMNPLGVRARIDLGEVYESLGDKRVAIRWYEEAYGLLDPTWAP